MEILKKHKNCDMGRKCLIFLSPSVTTDVASNANLMIVFKARTVNYTFIISCQ